MDINTFTVLLFMFAHIVIAERSFVSENVTRCKLPPCKECHQLVQMKKVCHNMKNLCSQSSVNITEQLCCGKNFTFNPLSMSCWKRVNETYIYEHERGKVLLLEISHKLKKLQGDNFKELKNLINIALTKLMNSTAETKQPIWNDLKAAIKNSLKKTNMCSIVKANLPKIGKGSPRSGNILGRVRDASLNSTYCMSLHAFMNWSPNKNTSNSCRQLPKEMQCPAGKDYCIFTDKCIDLGETCAISNSSDSHNDWKEACQKLPAICKRFDSPKYKALHQSVCPKKKPFVNYQCMLLRNHSEACINFMEIVDVCKISSKFNCNVSILNDEALENINKGFCNKGFVINPLTFKCQRMKMLQRDPEKLQNLQRYIQQFQNYTDILTAMNLTVNKNLNASKYEDVLKNLGYVVNRSIAKCAKPKPMTHAGSHGIKKLRPDQRKINLPIKSNAGNNSKHEGVCILLSKLKQFLTTEISLAKRGIMTKRRTMAGKFGRENGKRHCFATGECINVNATCSLDPSFKSSNPRELWTRACTKLPSFCNSKSTTIIHNKMRVTKILQKRIPLKYLLFADKAVAIISINITHINPNDNWICDNNRVNKDNIIFTTPQELSDHMCTLRFMERKTNSSLYSYAELSVIVTTMSGAGLSSAEYLLIWFSMKLPAPYPSGAIPPIEIPEYAFDRSAAVFSKYSLKYLQIADYDALQLPSSSSMYSSLPSKTITLLTTHNLLCKNFQLAVVACNASHNGVFQIKYRRRIKFAPPQTMKCRDLNKSPHKFTFVESIAYYPPINSEESVNLTIAYVCMEKTKNRMIESIGTNITFKIQPKNNRPFINGDLSAFGPPIPYDLTQNKGFSIGEVVDVYPKRYGKGYHEGIVHIQIVLPFMYDTDGPQKVGLAVIDLSQNDKQGTYKYSCVKGTWLDIDIRNNKVLLLSQNCMLRYDPKHKKSKIDYRRTFLTVIAWDGSNGKKAGVYTKTEVDIRSEAFSLKRAKLFILRFGCDGVAGSETIINECNECSASECEKKCDGQLRSDAKLDSCNVCYGGSTGVKTNSRRYRTRNGRFACCKQTTMCGMCPDNGVIKKDCEDRCMTPRSAYTKCGKCIGGSTMYTERDVVNSCGICVNDSTAHKMSCHSYISAINPTSMFKSLPVKKIQICIKGQTSNPKCSLQNTGNICQLMMKPDVKMNRHKYLCHPIMLKSFEANCIFRYIPDTCPAGVYSVNCSSIDGNDIKSDIKIEIKKHNLIPVISFMPTSVHPRARTMFVVEGDFPKQSRYFCNFHDSATKKQIYQSFGRSNETHIKCLFYARKSATGLILVMEDCNNRKSNELLFNVTCKHPMLVKSSMVKKRSGLFMMIHFDQAVVVNKLNPICKKTRMLRSNLMAVKISKEDLKNNSYICIPEDCYVCPGDDFRSTQRCLLVKIPPLICSINSPDVISTCNVLRLYPRMKGLRKANWTVRYIGGNAEDNDLVELKKFLADRQRGVHIRKFAKSAESFSFSLKEGKTYEFSMCATSSDGRQCCSSKNITVANENNIQCNIGEIYRSRNGKQVLRSQITYCGSVAKRKDFYYDWIVMASNKTLSNLASTRQSLVIGKSAATTRDRMLQVILKVQLQSNSNVTCETNPKMIKVIGVPLKIKLAGGHKIIYTSCSIDNLEIVAKINSPKLVNDEISWTCNSLGVVTSSEQNALLTRCSHKTNNTELEFGNDKKIKINVNEQLECGGEYNFTIAYTRESETTYKSIKLLVDSVHPPIIRCSKPRENSNSFKITCFVRGARKENISFTNFKDNDAYAVDLNFTEVEKKTKFIELLGNKLKRIPSPDVIKIHSVIDKHLLTEDSSYLFHIDASNTYGDGQTQFVEIINHGPPSGCNISILPTEGVAFNTSFELTIDNCESSFDGDLEFQAGALLNRKLRAKPFGSSNIIMFELPAGNKRKNNTLKIAAKARDRSGKVATITTLVTVFPSDKDNMELFKESNDKTQDAIERGDLNLAASQIANVNSGVVQQKLEDAEDKTNGTCQPLSAEARELREHSADQMITITNEDSLQEDTKEIAVSSLTEKVCPDEIVSYKRKNIVNIVYQKYAKDKQVKGRRKRRALSDEKSSVAETEKLMELSTITSYVDSYSNILFPIMYEADDQSSKKTFIDTLQIAKRSLASLLDGLQNVTATSDNIVLYSEMISTIVPNLNIHMPQQERVMFTPILKQEYGLWECTKNGDLCNGFAIATSSIKGDVFSSKDTPDFTLISNVFGLYLINPHTEGDYQIIDVLIDHQIEITLPLKVDNITKTVQCFSWNAKAWVSNECKTVLIDLEVVCSCSRIGHIAVFEISDNWLETTLAPVTTPTTDTVTESTAMYVSNTSTTSGFVKVTVTTQPAQSTQSTLGSTSPTVVVVKKECQFAFDADFNVVVSKFPSFADAQKSICSQTQNDLQLSDSDFLKCIIKAGSVVVIFTLAQDGSKLNTTLSKLSMLIQTNTFTVAYPDGTKLNAKINSLVVSNKQNVVDVTDDDKSNVLIVVIFVVAVLFVGILLIVVVFYLVKKKNRQKVEPSPTKSTSAYTLSNQRKEEDAKTNEGNINPAYDETI